MTLYTWTSQQTTLSQSTETSQSQDGVKNRGTINTTTRTPAMFVQTFLRIIADLSSPISGHFGSKILSTHL